MPMPLPSSELLLLSPPLLIWSAPVVCERWPMGLMSWFNETYETSFRVARATAAFAGNVTTRREKFLNFLILLPPDNSRVESIERSQAFAGWIMARTNSEPLPSATFLRMSLEIFFSSFRLDSACVLLSKTDSGNKRSQRQQLHVTGKINRLICYSRKP